MLIISEHADLENLYDLVKLNNEAINYSIVIVNYTD